MNMKLFILSGILIVNFILALLYLIWGIWFVPFVRKNQTEHDRGKYGIMFGVMIICPVVGILFFSMGYLLFRLLFKQTADLEDVIFNKERRAMNEKDHDIEGKLNLVPIEEAIAVSDRNSLRNLMLNVIKGDVQKSLAKIALALNSDDSETSHYAASVLTDELNIFRENVQRLYRGIHAEGEDKSEYCVVLIEYMNDILRQKIFIEAEQKYFVSLMEEAGNYLYLNDQNRIRTEYYEWICLRLLEIRDFIRTEMWCGRISKACPNELIAYTCKLKLYFSRQDRDRFFQTLEELKHSNITIDNETLELIRVFH